MASITTMQSNHLKSAYALEQTCYKLIGVDHEGNASPTFNRIAIITLTFKRPQEDRRKAKCLLDLILKTLKRKYGKYFKYVWVQERHVSGGIHFHLMVEMPFDVRSRTNIDVLLNWKDNMGNPAFRDRVRDCLPFLNEDLRKEFKSLKKLLPRYGIGRFDILPILTDADSVIAYLKKGIANHLLARFPEDKGARLWGCSKNVRVCNTRITFNTEGSRRFREKIATWGAGHGCHNMDQVRARFGQHWFYKNRGAILNTAV
ncbi:rolling circle replication-associated protein [Coraliomargarita parva]|uniref:rolling circle replication-associated protein n=1 Tax=Coraliomargarita parva TaxID=3014050 RepID=UPI0022B52412|nr:hypothetical protein [Coraliomargarita parva]